MSMTIINTAVGECRLYTCDSPRYTDTVSDTYNTRPSFDSIRRKPSSDCQQWNIPTLLTCLLTYLVRHFAGRSDADELIAEMEFGAEIACKSVYVAPLINYSASPNSRWEDRQPSHVTIQLHCKQSNRFTVSSLILVQAEFYSHTLWSDKYAQRLNLRLLRKLIHLS